MEQLPNKTFYLTQQTNEHEAECTSLHHPPALLGHPQRVQTELAQWLETYEGFRKPSGAKSHLTKKRPTNY
jgi:hypothetical protein